MPIGLAVALAGGLGAYTRYLLDYYAGDHLEPHHQVYVTLAVNLTGALLLGLLIGAHPESRYRIVIGIGFLASFTTFSTLIAQAYHALDRGHYATVLLLPTVSILVGVLLLWVGVLAGKHLSN